MVNLAAPMDASALGQIKSFTDVNQARQQAQLVNQAAQIDTASKANIYKTQVLSAAAGSGDQAIYQGALQHLSQNGIDVSDVPIDLATGTKYVESGRMALSPLGPLFNAQQKIVGNNQAAILGLGGVNQAKAAGQWQEVPNLGVFGLPSVAGINAMPAAQAASMPVQPSIQPIQKQPLDQGYMQMPPSKADMQVAAIDGPAPVVNISQTPTNSPLISSLPPYNPPAPIVGDSPGTTKANLDRYDQAYKMQNAGALKRQEAEASTTGDINAKDIEAAKKADELTKRLDMNLQAMEKLNKDVPSSGFIPQGSKVYLNQALSANGLANGAPAVASHQFDKINNDQILSDIQQFVATGGANTRINQTLEKIVQAASGIDKTASPEARAAMLKAARAEIANKNATQQNVVGGNQQYQDIPVTGSLAQQSRDKFNQARLPTFANPNDPAFAELPSGSQFLDETGTPRIKH